MLHIEDSKHMRILADNCIEFIDAAAIGDTAKVRQMLDKGMDPDTQGPKGWTGLRMAAVNDCHEVAYELLMRGAAVDAVNFTGQTALMMGCAYGRSQMATLLLFHCADPNRANLGGRTPLMIAASYGYVHVLGVLLDTCPRIDLDRTARNGKSALQMAREDGHDEVVRMLLAAGATEQTKDLGANRMSADWQRVLTGRAI